MPSRAVVPRPRPLLVITLLLAASTAVSGADYGTVTRHRVADGVYLFTTTGYGDVGLCGNVVAIVTDDGVVVFDSGGVPATAERILREIRTLTGQPVRDLVNSHWHWDHWGGNEVFKRAFPGLRIITEEKTRDEMLSVEPRWNDAGLRVQLPQYLAALEKRISAARAAGTSDAELRPQIDLLRADRAFLEAKLSLHKTIPDVTFSEAMTLWRGGREIRILHGRGITAGDTFVFLPKERILIAGDLVVDPVPFAAGGTFPADWLKTLERLLSLDPAIVIPGHGSPRNDTSVLTEQAALFREVMRQVREAKSKGLSEAQTQDALRAQAGTLAGMLGIHDPNTIASFRAYFLDTFVSRSYQELDHPLGDLPAGIRAPDSAGASSSHPTVRSRSRKAS